MTTHFSVRNPIFFKQFYNRRPRDPQNIRGLLRSDGLVLRHGDNRTSILNFVHRFRNKLEERRWYINRSIASDKREWRIVGSQELYRSLNLFRLEIGRFEAI